MLFRLALLPRPEGRLLKIKGENAHDKEMDRIFSSTNSGCLHRAWFGCLEAFLDSEIQRGCCEPTGTDGLGNGGNRKATAVPPIDNFDWDGHCYPVYHIAK